MTDASPASQPRLWSDGGVDDRCAVQAQDAARPVADMVPRDVDNSSNKQAALLQKSHADDREANLDGGQVVTTPEPERSSQAVAGVTPCAVEAARRERASRTRGSMLWAAYGDALGFVSELVDRKGLQRRTRGPARCLRCRYGAARGSPRQRLPEGRSRPPPSRGRRRAGPGPPVPRHTHMVRAPDPGGRFGQRQRQPGCRRPRRGDPASRRADVHPARGLRLGVGEHQLRSDTTDQAPARDQATGHQQRPDPATRSREYFPIAPTGGPSGAASEDPAGKAPRVQQGDHRPSDSSSEKQHLGRCCAGIHRAGRRPTGITGRSPGLHPEHSRRPSPLRHHTGRKQSRTFPTASERQRPPQGAILPGCKRATARPAR